MTARAAILPGGLTTLAGAGPTRGALGLTGPLRLQFMAFGAVWNKRDAVTLFNPIALLNRTVAPPQDPHCGQSAL